MGRHTPLSGQIAYWVKIHRSLCRQGSKPVNSAWTLLKFYFISWFLFRYDISWFLFRYDKPKQAQLAFQVSPSLGLLTLQQSCPSLPHRVHAQTCFFVTVALCIASTTHINENFFPGPPTSILQENWGGGWTTENSPGRASAGSRPAEDMGAHAWFSQSGEREYVY